jgi:acyl-CoA reductase-like NAD-dependent aldehyde dehydrogenase
MLQNPSLLPEVDRSRPTFEVRNPADPDSVVGEVSVMDRIAAKSCIEKSHEVLPSWRDGTTAAERSRLLTEWARLIQENKEDIATIMTMESGKPLQESRGEVSYGTSFLDFYAAEAVRPTGAGGGFMVPTPFTHAETGAPRGQIMAMQQAVGVTVSITPWNFPLSMVRIIWEGLGSKPSGMTEDDTHYSALLPNR